jgi:hypothetical protein
MAEEAKCAHPQVVRRVWEVAGKVIGEKWLCDGCDMEFYALPNFFGNGRIEVMEPQATLRDQFAMAAMQSDALQSALIAAAYIAHGKSFDGDVPNLTTAVKEHYETADAMMEARNK